MPEERGFSSDCCCGGSSATAVWLGGFLLFYKWLAWIDPDAVGCWIGVLVLYEVVNATLDVEPYAAVVAVRLMWRWKAPDFLSPACCSGFCFGCLLAQVTVQCAEGSVEPCSQQS
ncbi:hypothetical protein Nepgr_022963 [Nepenthes gracilis]|uniref:Uncharacterized protein n=1 Tax=Nepenthes gracilis TaxID=150966 RepID=A0AAD3XYX0_NEPGR|nr:hypothetical protein Nepgr_022963 [Nepenthes gracilis]